jgi:hypothetical protein
MVEDPLSEKVLWKEFRAGQTVMVDAADGEVVFTSREDVDVEALEPTVELAKPSPGGGQPEHN